VHGQARPGQALQAGYDRAGTAWHGLVLQAWHEAVEQGTTRHGRQGEAWYGTARCGRVLQAWRG
jgi:hypothetical protein